MLRPVPSSICIRSALYAAWGLGKCLGLGWGGSSRLAVGRSAGQGLAKANNQRPVGGKGLRVFGFARGRGRGGWGCMLPTVYSMVYSQKTAFGPTQQKASKRLSRELPGLTGALTNTRHAHAHLPATTRIGHQRLSCFRCFVIIKRLG